MSPEYNFIMIRPDWIRGKVAWGGNFNEVKELLRDFGLHSVCVEASCPNRGECWQERHVTFLIMGDICTRGCLFCDVKKGEPRGIDFREPGRIARAVGKLGIRYVVVTSVTRDDLYDKGAGHFAGTAREIKAYAPEATVELLVSDLGAKKEFLEKVAFSGAEVIGHNIEMPENLYGAVRPDSDYRTSLDTLKGLSGFKKKGARILVKSAIIAGLGEEKGDIFRTMRDLRSAGVDIVYIGQYLGPSGKHWPVKKYYSPDEFAYFEEKAREMGFGACLAGPMVRSSYRAYESFLACVKREQVLTR